MLRILFRKFWPLPIFILLNIQVFDYFTEEELLSHV
jgi:hypothetical protein